MFGVGRTRASEVLTLAEIVVQRLLEGLAEVSDELGDGQY
jgi:hypothetical protein